MDTSWYRIFVCAVLWRWPKRPAWHFVTLPFDLADEVEDVVAERGGFDSVRVEVRVGASVVDVDVPKSGESEFDLACQAPGP